MNAKVLMIQGTGSDVGKSTFVAGLCRIARDMGLKVAPFKSQNMSNNAAVTVDSGEIGRAQAVQALAAGVPAHSDMNPMLLKPESDTVSQVIISGKAVGRLTSSEYLRGRKKYLPEISNCFRRLVTSNELVLVEGAGSPAEVNLRDGDIANMGFAEHVGIPVCLLADIDRGGVLASLVGTYELLENDEKKRIKGFVINKFRGDPSLLIPGLIIVEDKTQWPSVGVVPWLSAASRIPSEDTIERSLAIGDNANKLKVVAPLLSRMANFDDADPLKLEPNVDFQFIPPGEPIPRQVDVIILFGTKSTIAEMEFIRSQGWHHDILSHARNGGTVLGICGGYQMLGSTILDPSRVDGDRESANGLNLLDVNTTMSIEKQVKKITGHCVKGEAISAYEIHSGVTLGPDTVRPMFNLGGRVDGAQNHSSNIQGTYLHGVFANDQYRKQWLNQIRSHTAIETSYWGSVDAALNELANEIGSSIDIDALFSHAECPTWKSRYS